MFNHIPFLKQSIALGVSVLLSILLLIFRIFYSSKITYIFLLWNLFLAIIPYVLTLFIFSLSHRANSKINFYFLVFIWLLFYPNSLYVITDFIHLKKRHNIPLWYDSILIFSFVWNGIFLGFFSLRINHLVVEKEFSKYLGWIFSFCVLGLSSVGIYLGRFLRFNSWDVFHNPKIFFVNLFQVLSNPKYPFTDMGIILILFVFYGFAYVTLVNFIELKNEALGNRQGYLK